MKKFTIDDLIISNERDQIIFDYLIQIRGKTGIEYLMNHYIQGGTKPYISNILKLGKIEIPDHIFKKNIATQEEVKNHLSELRERLTIKRNN